MDNGVEYIDDLPLPTEMMKEELQVLGELFKHRKRLDQQCVNWAPHKPISKVTALEKRTVGSYVFNVEKVEDAPRPSFKKEIGSFLGLVGYYQPFIPKFAAVAKHSIRSYK